MVNELSKALSVAEMKVQYDVQCRKVLAQKEVLAWILKNTAEEFQELSLEEIEGCIEGRPEIAAVGVNPGETIIGMANEDAVNGEGRIAYDIRFYAVVLRSREKIRLIINVEAQKSWYPGYKIPTRGIFYGARMISAQLGTEFCDSNYDDIKRSIRYGCVLGCRIISEMRFQNTGWRNGMLSPDSRMTGLLMINFR